MADPAGSTEASVPPTAQPAPVVEADPQAVVPTGTWERIKEHKVVQWTLAYAAAAYTLLHATEMISEALDWPHLIARILTLVLLLGVPVVITLAWYHGAKGLKRFSAAELTIITILLVIAGSVLWALSRTSGEHAPQVTQTAQQGISHSPATAASAPSGVSLAVLPFDDMSPEHNQEYFSDGLAEELLNQLAQIKELRVAGRTSSFSFKGKTEDLRVIGEKLGVGNLLQGSVRKEGNNLRITAHLINSKDGTYLWSQTFDRDLKGVFAVQEEIARTVAAALQLKLGAQDLNTGGTKNIAAFDEFLAGRALLNSNDSASMVGAVPHLERAVELDGAYIPARLWLIDAYTREWLGDRRDSALVLRKQNEVIDQLVKLVPKSPEASLALSYRAARERNLQTLERLLKESLPVTGESGVRARLRYGQFLMGVGQPDRAIAELERVRKDDPLDIFARTNLLLAYEVAGDLDRADSEMNQLLRLPGGASAPLLGTAITRAQGQHDSVKLREAIAAYGAVDKGAASNAAELLSWLDDPALARRALHREADVSRLEAGVLNVSGIAQWAAYFGDSELALRALDAMNPRRLPFETSAFILWRPVFHDLLGDPGFKSQLRKWGLVDYWRATGNWGNFCKPVGRDDFECH